MGRVGVRRTGASRFVLSLELGFAASPLAVGQTLVFFEPLDIRCRPQTERASTDGDRLWRCYFTLGKPSL
jgi:hypothetical protein